MWTVLNSVYDMQQTVIVWSFSLLCFINHKSHYLMFVSPLSMLIWSYEMMDRWWLIVLWLHDLNSQQLLLHMLALHTSEGRFFLASTWMEFTSSFCGLFIIDVLITCTKAKLKVNFAISWSCLCQKSRI